MNSNQTPPKKRPPQAQKPRQSVVNTRQGQSRPKMPPAAIPVTEQKRGISPAVILLLFVAIVAILLVYATLGPKNHEQEKPQSDLPSQNGSVVIPPNDSNTTPPSEDNGNDDPPAVIPTTKKPNMTVNSVTENFPSGSYVIYGYPSVKIEDAPEIAEKINQKLTLLVDDTILPIVEQLRAEDTPGNITSRLYNFEILAGCGFYSVVATVDINEGITADRNTFGWTFLAETGEFVELRKNCTDLYHLAVTIDGCIENITSYDQIIHAWLKDTLTAEYDSEEFSFYFSNEAFIAVINTNLRLNSYDRDPILIQVPYEKIINIFPNQ